jgi:hypothetical protein
MDKHHFISIAVMPVTAEVTATGDVAYEEVPEQQVDHSPEVICQVCWQAATADVVDAECPGAKVPDDLSSIT